MIGEAGDRCKMRRGNQDISWRARGECFYFYTKELCEGVVENEREVEGAGPGRMGRLSTQKGKSWADCENFLCDCSFIQDYVSLDSASGIVLNAGKSSTKSLK